MSTGLMSGSGCGSVGNVNVIGGTVDRSVNIITSSVTREHSVNHVLRGNATYSFGIVFAQKYLFLLIK